ncbi:hypothetical protein Syn7502_02054 [Synechococcus sp. PCC 7502]|uniref:hypothetical protein n=1 Tax=Synechococcus sp. PCC 7502 TaxID=1173263 RepID=UPI00029F8B51|nr:hypothetical protein [Synechococcus sp. PCC 7502]AFY74076.1 hypothetical protein Syn7502_02054 [Synechococcus sp. PCC 7502]
MPRLVGKKFNPALSIGLGLLIAALGTIALEYFGVINIIPDTGKEPKPTSTSTQMPVQINKSNNSTN